VRRFPIRFSGPNRYLWLPGLRSSRGVVRLDLDPPPRARVAAVLRPRVREPRVSVEDPDGLLRALAPSP